MEKFDLSTLIYTDDENVRKFSTKEFNFALDKKSRMSFCYGRYVNETPTYDPLSPEIIDIFLDKDFNFEKNKIILNKIFNIQYSEKENKFLMISTISSVNLIIKNIYDENINEIIKLYEYLNNFNMFINLIINYDNVKELRDVIRAKLFKIQNIIIEVTSFKSNELMDQLNLLLSKQLIVSYNFYLSKDNYEEFKKLIENNFPKFSFSNIFFKLKTSNIVKKKVIELLKEQSGNFTIFDNTNKFNESFISKSPDGLFKCYVNFSKKCVSYSSDFENSIKFMKIKDINSYWQSDLFNRYRESLVSCKYFIEELPKDENELNEKKAE